MFRTPAFVSGPYVKPSPSKKPKVDLENKEARKKKERENRITYRKKAWKEKPVPPVVKTYMSNMKAAQELNNNMKNTTVYFEGEEEEEFEQLEVSVVKVHYIPASVRTRTPVLVQSRTLMILTFNFLCRPTVTAKVATARTSGSCPSMMWTRNSDISKTPSGSWRQESTTTGTRRSRKTSSTRSKNSSVHSGPN
jgi:hypothetical protein